MFNNYENRLGMYDMEPIIWDMVGSTSVCLMDVVDLYNSGLLDNYVKNTLKQKDRFNYLNRYLYSELKKLSNIPGEIIDIDDDEKYIYITIEVSIALKDGYTYFFDKTMLREIGYLIFIIIQNLMKKCNYRYNSNMSDLPRYPRKNIEYTNKNAIIRSTYAFHL